MLLHNIVWPLSDKKPLLLLLRLFKYEKMNDFNLAHRSVINFDKNKSLVRGMSIVRVWRRLSVLFSKQNYDGRGLNEAENLFMMS